MNGWDSAHAGSLHLGYERLIGSAATDPSLRRDLLRAPAETAMAFGLHPDDAALIADIRASDLASFARALRPRIYGPSERRSLPARRNAG